MKFASIMFLLAFSATANAGPWARQFQDIKLPTQAMLERNSWLTPIVATTNYIKTSTAQTNATLLDISTFTHQPDYARNLTITPGGTTVNVGACTVVVTGKNFHGNTITENFAFLATASTATVGAKAFASVSDVTIPAACAGGTGVTWIVGVGSALGLSRCMDDAGKYVFSEFNGAYETTRGTAAFNASAIESNTFAPNGTMDGTKKVEVFYVQNYRCFGNN